MSHPKFLRTLRVFLFALALMSVRAQGHAQTALSNAQSVDALGPDLFLQSGSTGMVLVVVRDDQVFFRGYGETAPNSHQAPTQDSVLRLCSLTKIFTTDVLTKLVADKTVRLDDPLQHFAPKHVVVPRRVQSITLGDLATHTSGLPRELGNGPHGTPHFTFPDYRTRWRWLPNLRLRSTPGTAALYSNVAYDFLSDALQAASHKQYAALLAERTLSPLHMQHTTFFPSEEQCSHLLTSAHDEKTCAVTEPTAGSSGLYSTAADMAIWLQYLLGTGGQGIPHKTLPLRPSTFFLLISSVKRDLITQANQPVLVSDGFTSYQLIRLLTSSKRQAAAPASRLISPSTTLGAPPSSSLPRTVPSTLT